MCVADRREDVIKLEIYLPEEMADRLWAVKALKGKNNLTANEFAKELIEGELYRLHPKKVEVENEIEI